MGADKGVRARLSTGASTSAPVSGRGGGMMDGEGVLVQPQRGTPAEDPSLHELKPNAIGLLQSTIIGILVTLFAVLGIQFTARFQMSIAFVEYAILILFCGVGIYGVFFAHWAGTVHPSAAWFTLKGVGGKGSLAAGMLIAIYLFT